MNEIKQYQGFMRRRAYSEFTIRHYLNDLELFEKHVQKPWIDVRKQDVGEFIERQSLNQAKPRTINRRLYAIKSFFLFLKEELDWELFVPVKATHFIRTAKPLPKTLEDQEVEQFFEQISDIRDLAIFYLMLHCGLRVGEIAALNLQDVNLFKREIRFFGKGKKERILPLSDVVFLLLKQCATIRPKEAPLFFWNKKFPQNPLKINSIQRLMKRYAKKASLDIHCHLFRHTFARNMTENGVERTVLRDLMGHASLSSTDGYGKLSDPYIKESYFKAFKKVDETHFHGHHK